jgi:RND family efflux transporter MFP subunit
MRGGKLVLFGIVFLAIIGTLFATGLIPRLMREQTLDASHKKALSGVPNVYYVEAQAAPQTENLTLPGNIGAIQYATIYARVDGYLKRRLVDIGARVHEGQLLATVDTPELDEELKQAQADQAEAEAAFEQAKAGLKETIATELKAEADLSRTKTNLDYSHVTAARWDNLAQRGAVSLQSRDEKIRAYNAEQANVTASGAEVKAAKSQVEASRAQVEVARAQVVAKKANVAKVAAKKAFQQVVAPFSGVITYRKVDAGDLISSGSTSNNHELFQLAKIDRLRIYINVPQTFARYLKTGFPAELQVSEYPERKFIGTITNVAGGLDPNSRTMQTEIQIDNRDEALMPGMYAQVTMIGKRTAPWLKIPGTTLVTKDQGQFVAIIDGENARFKAVQIGRDFGDEVEIVSGVKPGDKIIVNPPVDLIDGEKVAGQPMPSAEASEGKTAAK